jgi:hypothetical protein
MTTFSKELQNCDGENDLSVISSTSCTIPISTLKAAPFSLTDGMTVFVKVIAFNSIGDSPDSVIG